MLQIALPHCGHSPAKHPGVDLGEPSGLNFSFGHLGGTFVVVDHLRQVSERGQGDQVVG